MAWGVPRPTEAKSYSLDKASAQTPKARRQIQPNEIKRRCAISKAMSLALRFRHSFESRFFLFMFPPSFVVSSLQTGPNGSLPVRTNQRWKEANSTETPKVSSCVCVPEEGTGISPVNRLKEINGLTTSFYGEALLPQDRMQRSGADKIKIATSREHREKFCEGRSENETVSGVAGSGQSPIFGFPAIKLADEKFKRRLVLSIRLTSTPKVLGTESGTDQTAADEQGLPAQLG